MYLLVKAAGKYWRMDFRFADRRDTLTFGVYPAVSLAKARQKREKARELLADGIDPKAAKAEEKQAKAAAAANTFEAVAREWHETKASSWSVAHRNTTLERMEKNIFPWVRKLPQIENNMKIDASISLRRRDEEVKVYGEPDCWNLG